MARRWFMWLALIVMALLAGAAINVCMAWGCTLVAGPLGTGRPWIGGATMTHRIDLRRSKAGEAVALTTRSDGFAVGVSGAHFGYRTVLLVPSGGQLATIGDAHDFDDATKDRAARASWANPIIETIDARWRDGNLPGWLVAGRRPTLDRQYVSGAGWPFVSFWSNHLPGTFVIGMNIGRTDGRPLPMQPVWTGFALNTLLFGAIIALTMLSVPIRRELRLRRGHCPRCAYDLASNLNVGCPECGWQRRPPTLSS